MADKIDRAALAQTIRELDGIDNDTRAALLELVNRKKYGLVWEEHPEDVEERLREQLPVLEEDRALALTDGGKEAPNHVLIEGDNLEALTALTYTHEGKIDVIYIDPPYNTGNKDFSYNDSYVDSEDGYRHSKWLSFMSKRLRIAKRLLSDKGVIFISIDDHEQANLKLLCDEIFGSSNSVGEIIWETATDNNPTQISIDHEYVICYAKVKDNLDVWSVESEKAKLVQEKYEEIKRSGISNVDEIRILLRKWIRYMKQSKEIDLSGVSHYDYVDDKGVFYPGNSSNTKPGGYMFDIVHPITGMVCAKPQNGYRWTSATFWDADKRGDVLWGKDETIIPKIKKRIETATELLKSYYYEDGRTSSKMLEDIIGVKKFKNPKPVRLISRLVQFSSYKSSIILDFFAGSGTTMHATMQLNKEDGGHRQCILVQGIENDEKTKEDKKIAREVTYERNKRVIQGYTTPKGVQVEGLEHNNLRYYRTKLLPRDTGLAAQRRLMEAATELLCIKHDVYEECTMLGGLRLKPRLCRYFADEGKAGMLIIYRTEAIGRLVEEIKTLPEDAELLVYVFSLDSYAMDADFEEVADRVTLCALPRAIYNAYQKVLPKKGRRQELPPLATSDENTQLTIEEGGEA